MYRTSQKFKDNIYAPVRSAHGRVTFDISDTTASGDVSGITVTSNSPLSLPDQLINKARTASYKTATMEKDRFLLDGSFSFADDTLSNNGELGWSSSVICDDNGWFLTNLLGTGGNSDSSAGWVNNGSDIAIDTTNKVSGTGSLKVTVNGSLSGVGTAFRSIVSLLNPNKYYVALCEVKNGTATRGEVYVDKWTAGGVGTSFEGTYITSTTGFSMSWVRLKPTDIAGASTMSIHGLVLGATGTYANFDNFRLYEINPQVYDALPTMTAAQISAMFPYTEAPQQQTLTFNFNNNHSSAGLTVTFDQLNGEYATDFDMTAYDSTGAVIDSKIITGNTDIIAVPFGQMFNYRKVSVTIKKWSKPNRRARVIEVDFGFVKQYDDDSLISMNLIEEMDLLTGKVPSTEFRFTIDNSDRLFNILNPVGIYKYLQQKQQIIGEIGLEVGNGLTEWVPVGTFLLQEWQSDEGSLTASFTSRTNLDLMASFDYENLTPIQNQNLYGLALSLFSTSGLGGVPVKVAFTQPWDTQPYAPTNVTVNSSGGTLNVTSLNNDPMILMYSLGSFDPNVYRYVEIKYRVVSGGGTSSDSCQIFYLNSRYTDANGGQVVYSDAYNRDGQWHITYIDMWSHPDYKLYGNITGWRFDWSQLSGVTMEFDYVRLVDKQRGNPTVFNIDPALLSVPTNGLVKKTNCRDVLQMVAIAGCANLYVTRDNVITLKCQNRTRKVRYIRDWISGGSNANTSNHWVEVQAFNENGNVALNKFVSTNMVVSTGSLPLVTNGDASANGTSYVGTDVTLNNAYVQVDLGSVYDISLVKVWHFWLDLRIYNGTKTEVSEDGVTWFTVFDSATAGTYAESAAGRTYYMDGVSRSMPPAVDSADFDNMYNEPQIALDKAIRRVEVTNWTNLDTKSIVGVNSDTATLGDTMKLEGNTLIDTPTRALAVAQWFMSQLKYRATYRVNWRGNPALELNDVMSFENTYGGVMSAFVTHNEIDYAGYLTARTQAKGAVN